MPMDGMDCRYVKDIGFMLVPLAQSLSANAAIERMSTDPLALRVQALPLKGATPAAAPLLTDCSCTITAKLWA
jgi:hypothetical protein